ncbi:hypothetical protein [Pseudoponticoccus marisrubri]|uniref:Uncharacterized protein n=1 Tax=Pseudoponticoccus marisrubri TaxID=1685382 RepID=A0A0W7WI36_9RHOB|nr:hypothetical protein [Pseudoponticoccus marisrubri]KUF10277.1 hypothetical protein AVJ23_12780 [Pseudoponticoccus marisrubri]
MIRTLFLAALLATPAAADEIWTSDYGRITYEDEIDGAALFAFRHPGGQRAMLYIPGLAGNYDNRHTHRAYWFGEGPGFCEMALSAGGAAPSRNWGQALISFDTPAFPTSFTLTMGDCFDPLSYSLRAETWSE